MLDSVARSQKWAVSPSSTIDRRFYPQGMSVWSNGANLTVHLQDAGSHTRVTLDCALAALIDNPMIRKRNRKLAQAFMVGIGGALDPD